MKKRLSTFTLLTVASLSLASPVLATSEISQPISPESDQSQILYHGISVEEAQERFAQEYPGQEFKVEYVANGLGGASLANKETGEVNSIDPATGQRYSLEQLLTLGQISEEEYQAYAAARQVTQVAEEEANGLGGMTIPTDSSIAVDASEVVSENPSLSEIVTPAVGVEETTAVSDSSKGLTTSHSKTKILPKTSDTVSIFGVLLGGLMVGLGGFAIKKGHES